MNSNIMMLGILVSIVFTEFTALSPAGLIVPAYFAMYISSPSRIVFTLVVAFITYAVVKLLDKVTIIYGRRKFALMIIIGFVLNIFASQVSVMGMNISVIGYIIPAIIANEFDKQGVKKSLMALALAMGIIVLILMVFGELAI